MKALASDFDGTLYFEDGVREHDQKAILNFQKHHLFGLCTGRPFIGVQHYIKDIIQPDFYIVSSGACILDKDGQVLYEQTLSKDTMQAIYQQYHHQAEVSIQADFRIYTLLKDSKIPIVQTYVETLDDVGSEHIFGLSINAKNEQQAKQWTQDLNETYDDIVAFQNKEYIDIVKKGCSKGAAIQKLKELLHLDYVYGIGDSYNDIPMLESADCSFTFHDSPESVQKKATYVVSSINEAIQMIEGQ
ncbi:HAD family hydrolase [Allocoprobacillus halotolerans]|uniref:HAD family hydrolase n=1 Tax=Allocoprobacillus halotolerans TaxID=2944914 RepID=A0ABY5I139_9FIRM|nr:HAD-IIB family hydrolase [Allocoprobacillus halotolerans]UTY37798.1 HAD family hydrolase [Allocoprobacillus halotolerans]